MAYVEVRTAKQLNPEIGQLIIFHHNNSVRTSVFICTSDALMLCLSGGELHKQYSMRDFVGFDYQFMLI